MSITIARSGAKASRTAGFGCAALAIAFGTAAIAAPAGNELSPEIEMAADGAGEALAVIDLCGWDLAQTVEAALEAAAKKAKMPQRLQQTIRARMAAVRNAQFRGLSDAGRARTIAELCTAQERAFLERLIAQVSFE